MEEGTRPGGAGGLGGGGAATGAEDEFSHLFTCIAFDPGGTTGWALVCCHVEAMQDREYKILDNITFWACGQLVGPFAKQANEMMDLVVAWPRNSAVVSEDFLLRQFRMDRTLLDPVRMNERFAQLLYNYDIKQQEIERLPAHMRYPPREPFLQQPAMAMTTMTDARLKAAEESVAFARGVGAAGAGGAGGVGSRGYGFYSATAGRPHARDALRHAFTFMRRERHARLGNPPTSLYLPGWVPAQGA